MQKNKNRKGLALGAIFSLVGTLLVSSPAIAADESSVVAFPNAGLETQTTMLGDETFQLAFRFGTGVSPSLRDFTNSPAAGFGFVVTKPAGVTVSATVSSTALIDKAVTGTTAVLAAAFPSSLSNVVTIGLPDRTSVSAAVSITVTPFLDLNRNGLQNSGEPSGTPIVLNFVPWSAMGAALTLEQPLSGDRGATASFSVTQGSLNWTQLKSNFAISISSTADLGSGAGTASANISGADLSAATATTASNTAKGVYSASYTIGTAPFTTAPVVQSVSAVVLYGGVALTAVQKLGVTALGVSAVSISPVVGTNVTGSAAAATARFNSAFVLRAFPYSASATTSVPVASAFTVSGITSMEFSATAGVILNGVTYTSSATFLAAGFTLPAGQTTVAVSTFGQDDSSGTDNMTFKLTSQLKTATLAVALEVPSFTIESKLSNFASLTGVSKTFDVDVMDQWGVAPVRTDIRVAATVALGGSTSALVSGNVAAGMASVAVTPIPATRTGSAVVTFQLQTFNQNTQVWDNNSGVTDTLTWNVYSYAAGSDSITSRTVSISASISYGVALSYSTAVVAVGVTNSFSDVTVAAPGLIIQNSDEPTVTASDTLTVAANGKTANFKFTSRLAGTYTVTITNGTASTTSTVVVNPATDDAGKTITFDTTAIGSGSTATITGTLKDANGNPVNTSGSATITVTYAGTGIAIGTPPTETDADGEFSVTVLTGANDKGIAVITAVYNKTGAATATVDKITATQNITVGAEAVVTAPVGEKKLTVGTFNGYIAIYAKGYEGSKLSAKVAGKWLTVAELSSFQRVVRKTGAGYAIMVDLYIDGVLAQSSTTVTK